MEEECEKTEEYNCKKIQGTDSTIYSNNMMKEKNIRK